MISFGPRRGRPVASAGMPALALALAALLALAGCAGNRSDPSEGWSGVAAGDGALFVGTRDGRIIELIVADTARGLQATAGREFNLQDTVEGQDSGRVPPAFYATPAVSDGRLYAASYQGFVYSMTAAPGDGFDSLANVGVFEVDGNKLSKSIAGSPVVSGDTIVVAATEDANRGRLYVLDRTRLDEDRPAERCRYPDRELDPVGQMWSTPLVVDGIAYFGDLSHRLHAVSTVDCDLIWDAPTEVDGAIIATPIMVAGTLYFGSFDRAFYSADPQSGSVSRLFEAEDWFWSTPVSDGELIYAPNMDGALYAFDIASGSVAWTYSQQGANEPILSQPALINDSVIVASDRGVVTLVDNQGNRLDDTGSGTDRVRAPVTIEGNTAYVHWLNETVTAFAVNRGNLDLIWEFELPGF